MLGFITTALSAISSPVTKYLSNKGELNLAEHTRDLAIINNQARLASDKQSANSNWEMAALQDKDKWLRRFSFVLFTSPIFLAIGNPEYWATVVVQLETVPEWMLNIWFYMIAGIWGMAELKNSIPAMLSGMRKGK
jgi:hypothetical protein